MTLFTATLKREWLLVIRNPQAYLQGFLFFTLVIFLFGFVLENNKQAYLYIWLAAVLSQLLTIDALFKQDYLDGSLDLMLLNRAQLPFLIIAKLLPHILVNMLPLLLFSMLLGFMFEFSFTVICILFLSFLLGIPVLFLLGALGAALTVSLKNSSLLTGIILLPFYVPALLFALSAVQNSAYGLPYQGALALLGAQFILCAILCPLASAAILKVTAA